MASGASKHSLVVVTTTLPASPGDGTPEFVLTLAESLVGWNVTVVAPRCSGAPARTTVGEVELVRVPYLPARLETIANDAILPALRAHPWRGFEVPFLVLGLLLGTMREVRRTRAALVNAHWIFPAGLIALVVRWLMGVPYVVTVHGGDAYTLEGPVLGRVKQRILSSATAVAPVSTDIATTLGLDGSVVLPMGVDTAGIRDSVGDRTPDPNRLVMVGRLADKKGFDFALRAIARLPEMRLEVIGSGPEEQPLRDLAEQLRVGDRVEFRGKRPRGDVMEALRRAAAVVIPSVVGAGGDMDGTPVVLCEAMAAGVPVVASDLGGLGEQIESGVTGLLVPPGDVDALASALRSVRAGEVDLEALGRNASAYAEQHLDIDSIAASYDQLLRHAGRGPA